MDAHSGIEEHARIGPRDKWGQSQFNALVGCLIWGVLGALAFGFGAMTLWPAGIAYLGTVGFVGGLCARAWVLVRRQKLQDRAARAKVAAEHDRKQQEFERRFQEAKARGDLDEWSEKQ